MALSLVVQPIVIKKASVRKKRDQMSIERGEKKKLEVKAEAGRTDRGPVDRTTVETPLILEPLMQG